MIPPLRYVFFAVVLGGLCMVFSLRAAGPSPDSRVTKLDQLVALTPEQKIAAAEIFQNEDQAIAALPAEDRLIKGSDARQNSRKQIRALLNREQRNKYDLAPQSAGGNLRANPDFMVERLDQLVHLTPEQKQQAKQILWNEFADQIAAVPEGEELSGFLWREPTRDLLRALFTPEQLAKYNSTPQSEAGGMVRRANAPAR